MSAEPKQPPKPSKSRWLWWVAAGATAAVLLAAGALAWYYLGGRTVWTDGRGIRRPADLTRLRHVLWTAPVPVAKELNTPGHEYEPATSPDGKTLYFVRGLPGKGADLYASHWKKNAWAAPARLAGVNTDHDELGPRLTPDGRFLVFYSDRPGGLGQYDLWAAERTEEGWSPPFNLGPTVNSKYNDYSPAVTPDGKRLIFATNRKAAEKLEGTIPWRATIRQRGLGDYDLFVAERVGAATQPATQAAAPATAPAPPPATAPSRAAPLRFAEARELEGVNSPHHEGACCVSPAGDFLYFASNRPGGLGGFDLYRCRLDDGRCGTVTNLGPEINTPHNDMDPQIDLKGFLIYFSSDRAGEAGGYDLFAAESREVYAIRARRAPPELSWSLWALVIALAVLIPLLLFLRAAGYKHLSLLQKCVVVSLLAHIGLTMLLSLLHIYKPILHHVAEAAGLTTSVNLEVAREVAMRMEIRRQITDVPVTELPVADPTLAALARKLPQALPQEAPQPPELNVPQTEVRPVPLTVQPEAPRLVKPQVAERVSLPQPTVRSEAPTIRLSAEPVVIEVERQPTAPPAPALPDRRPARTDAPSIAARDVRMTAIPARPNRDSLVDIPATERPPVPDVQRVAASPALAAPPAPDVTAPDVPAPRVSARPATAPAVLAVRAVSNQVRTASPRAERSAATLAVPTAQRVGESLAVAAAVTRAPAPAVTPVALDVAAANDAPEIKLPVLAAPDAGAAEPAVVASSLRAPRDLEPRPLVGVSPPAKPEALEQFASAAPAKAAATSPLSPAMASIGRPRAVEATTHRIVPSSIVTPLLRLAGPGKLASPDTFFQRSFEQRQKFVDAMGGSKESEAAVARALVYLARNQEPEGAWPHLMGRDNRRRGRQHDGALTGLSVLCFLAADHTPDKPGPYRECARKAIDYLVRHQKPDGDLRHGGDMYSHAIAALAVAEAAAMTRNPSYRVAAIKAGRFIVNAQNRSTGGWRYRPGEPGDTSVFGWQIMALHSIERSGVKIPSETRKGAFRWLDRVTRSPHKMLAGYQNQSATKPMTAEAVLSRVFLGQQLTREEVREFCDFLESTKRPEKKTNYYYWYYGSLALMQLQNDAWQRWNVRIRDKLIAMQQRDGSWEARSSQWGSRGGKVYTTALSTLTLEVYYRYLPMYGGHGAGGR